MTEPILLEKQFDLGGVVFGLGAPGIDIEKFKPDGITWRTQDGDSPTGDNRDFGRDKLGATEWGFDLYTNCDTEDEAYEALARLEAVWRAPDIRDTPQAVMPLRFRLRGRDRVLYGRPGRWSAPPGNESLSGRIPITCDFRRQDTLYYSDTENDVEIPLAPSTVGGLKSPLKSPLTSLAGSAANTHEIEIGGTHPTWITVVFEGVLTYPVLKIAGWTAGWTGTTTSDNPVTLDSRPWRRSTTYKTGGSAAGKLDRRTKMQEMLLAPGKYIVDFTAAAAGSNPRARIRWRDADSSL